MKTKTQHTPTPWTLAEDGRTVETGDGCIVSGIVASRMFQPNMDFMLLAVNNHEAQRVALIRNEIILRRLIEETEEGKSGHLAKAIEISLTETRKAISQAEGGK